MAKYRVNRGYVFFDSRNRPHSEGVILELTAEEIRLQAWKVTKVEKEEVKKEVKKEDRKEKSLDETNIKNRSVGRPKKIK